jgi:hypothetical protein|uniref:Uncharacterized protein n=1 Tax=viral metagenome TaxID=1070528 RepID=A0A6C0BKF9_9ZZZZ
MATTVVLRSVDNTPYYADDLHDPQHLIYTCQGIIGDQNLNNPDNQKLLHADQFWVYRVQPRGRHKTYIWYGRYHRMGDPYPMQHVDDLGQMRQIYLIHLERDN